MNDTDLARLAERLRRAAELLEQRGVRALTVAASWRGHTRGATYDPSTGGGLRHDSYTDPDGTEHVVAIPHDPTGEADARTVDQLRHPRLVAAIGALDVAAGNVTSLVLGTVPERAAKADDDDGPGDGWCASCYRDRQYLEPEHVHADGRAKHKGLCSWCAGFQHDYHRRAPVELLRRRHEGRRITTADVAEAFKPKAKKTKGKRAS